MNVSVPILIAVIAIWSVIALIATLFLDRLRRTVKRSGVSPRPETDSTFLDDQPTEVLANAALRQRFNKILVKEGLEHLR